MSIPFWIAGGLALFMSVGHSVFGTFFFFRGVEFPSTFLGDSDMSHRLVHGGWHFLAVPLFMSALGLFALARGSFDEPLVVAKVIFWYYAGQSLILLYYQIPRPIMFVKAPLWLGIIGIPILILFATKGQVIF